MNKTKTIPYREDEPYLEYIEDSTPHVELWGTEVEKKLMSESPETLSKLELSEKERKVVDINPRELRLSPLNPRQRVYESEELRELRENISLNKKIYIPLIVRLKQDVPEIISGGLRWRISILLDFETVPVLVQPMSDEEALSLIESSDHNVELDSVSRGEHYAFLMKKYGWSLREVARIKKVSYQTVSNYLTVTKFPETTKEVIREGKMSFLIALDILDELNEIHYGKIPPKEIVSYTKEYLRLSKDKRKPLTRQGFKEWMLTKRTHDFTRKLADYGIPEEKRFGKPYKSKAEKEIEGMKREIDEMYTSMPPNIAEKKAKALLEFAPEEVQKEYEGKVFGKDYSLARLEHDITVAEGNEPLLKRIELEEEHGIPLFKTEKEADEYFKKYRGRLLGKIWVGEVDPFLYAESKEEEKEKQ